MKKVKELERQIEFQKAVVRVLKRENESLQSQINLYRNTGVDWDLGHRERGTGQ